LSKVNSLKEKLRETKCVVKQSFLLKEKVCIRIFMEGVFDVMHYGHMNAFRLGRSLGTHLIVGINSDETIKECKGAPIMSEQERLNMVQSCKFVDEVIPGCPYVMNEEYLNDVIQKYSIDYVVHGDDPCIVNGKDVYESAKKTGKYRIIPRTEGVSTTDIVGRMLTFTKENNFYGSTISRNNDTSSLVASVGNDFTNSLLCKQSKFLTTR